MIKIYPLISPDCIFINPPAKSKEELLRLMTDRLADFLKIEDNKALFSEVLAREDISVTAIGSGCAVPHALTESTEKTAMAAAVIPGGIDFSSTDGEPVTIVLMMIGPKSGVRTHLKLLSKTARLLHNEDFRNSLISSGSPQQLLSVFIAEEG